MKSSQLQYLTILHQSKREFMELIYLSQKLEFELSLLTKKTKVAIISARTIQEEQEALDTFEKESAQIAKKFDSVYESLYNSL